jgi:TatD DNase family protein
MAGELPELVDTHCHLDFDSFDQDRDAVVAAAHQSGVRLMINPAVDIPSVKKILEISGAYPDVYAAVGVHPNDAETWTGTSIDELHELANHPKVVAIGEIGLDYYWKKTPVELQKKVLLEQLKLAENLKLPVIIHNREASDDILAILGEWQEDLMRSGSPLAEKPGVLHSFSGNVLHAEKAIEHNFFIGITGPVTFTNAKSLQSLVAGLPLDHLLVETDSPFLTPHPFRGKRNEPGRVLMVAQKIADLHGRKLEDIAKFTTANARRLFFGEKLFD